MDAPPEPIAPKRPMADAPGSYTEAVRDWAFLSCLGGIVMIILGLDKLGMALLFVAFVCAVMACQVTVITGSNHHISTTT